MKILMVDSLVGNDYTMWLCRGLSEAGHDVTLVTTENRDKNASDDFTLLAVSPPKGAGQHKVLKMGKYIVYLIWLFFYILLRANADVVHFQFFRRPRMECLYFPLLRLATSNLLYTAHNILPHEHTKVDYYLRYLVYHSATKIIVHTDGVKQKLLEAYSLNADKVYVVPAVRPFAEVRDEVISQEVARKKLGLAPEHKILLFFGYIRAYKGLDLLLDSFDIARKSIDQLTLVVAGKPYSDELLELYEQKIEQMTYHQHVDFRPEFVPTEEMEFYFWASDAIALPYRQIDLSAVLQVAFTYRRAVLVTDVGDFSTFIENGKNGYIAEEQTPESFARIIECAFEDLQHLSQMGVMAYEMDRTYPDWKQIGELTAEVYRS